MRHGNNVRKFGRKKNQRIALMKGLAISLIECEKIKTTSAKAKELKPYAEKLVTLARKGDTASRRLLLARLMNNTLMVKKLMSDIAPKYIDRKGGYTRITRLAPRKSDASPMSYIEFV